MSLLANVNNNVFIRDILLYLPSFVIPGVMNVLSLIIYTRLFSPEKYGDYSLILAAISVLSIFVYSWINQSLIRFYTFYEKQNMLEKLYTSLLLLILLSIFVILLFLSITKVFHLISVAVIQYVEIIILYLIVASIFETILTLFRSQRKPELLSLYRCISSITSILLSLILIYSINYDISSILISYIIINTLLITHIVIKYDIYKFININHLSKEVILEIISYGVPLSAGLFFSWILMLSDRFIIDFYKGSYEVGLYSAASQIGDLPISTFTSLICFAALPIIINTWENHEEEKVKCLLTEYSRYFVIICIPVFIIILSMSKEVAHIMGGSYASSYTIIPLISIGSLLSGLVTFVLIGLQLKKMTVYIVLMIGISGSANILINLILVPKYGYLGSGIATSISYTIYLILSCYLSYRYIKWFLPLNTIKNVLASSLFMSGSIYLLLTFNINLYITILISIIFYLISLILCNEMDLKVSLSNMLLKSL